MAGQMIRWGELANVLRVMRCDTDADGKFNVDGNITSFLGMGDEFVIGEDAVYYVDGTPRSLAHAIAGTSYSHPITVI